MSTQRRNTGALIGGSILIAFGILALLSQLFQSYDFWSNFWPFIVIAFGAMFFVGMIAGGKTTSGLAIPGTIITAIGLMLLVQNLTNYWESWSYGWTVILMSVGLGIFIMGAWEGSEHRRRAGLRVLEIGVILFIIFGAFFEMIFASAGLSQYIFPAALILLGLYLIIKRSGLLPVWRDKNTEQDDLPNQEM